MRGPAHDLGEVILAVIEVGGRHCGADRRVVVRIVDDERCDRTDTDRVFFTIVGHAFGREELRCRDASGPRRGERPRVG